MSDVSSISRDTQHAIYRKMYLLKANDERVRKLLRTGRIVATYYSYRGQEVIPAALSVNLTDDDYLCTIYRGIHDMLAKGLPLKDLWAEIAGRVDGTCKGKGGPMHLTHPSKGVMVTTGIVGSSMPIANGLGWAAQLEKNGRVSVANFGDGAANIGAFHEALNLASLWKLPVIFVCQNNRYAEHTAYAEGHRRCPHLRSRGGLRNARRACRRQRSVEAMYAAAREAIERARDGGGPTLIEAMTFRFQGHVFGDSRRLYVQGRERRRARCGPGAAISRSAAEGGRRRRSNGSATWRKRSRPRSTKQWSSPWRRRTRR